ncbi:sigma-54-dependent Fis family transcriptional regulator [Segnochrobactrum spirostomi]|uniref:Sigma-54-dependent Fis family transcriptional regulator n=1 Tax=Segnochrobactrum spirostomi TaxID=2608987 RepID=A0A6A7Y6V4_9HYPH|nr:sigma-54-dependent Fis family transcriptional regulator [Segnochrobactrum spirostomi]MQT14993.1 sigma-54-dependent Fis family transcriptional regulator [Segnochrobactrum spirostomi]
MREEQAAHIDELVRAATGRATRRDSVIEQSWRRCMSEHRLDPEVLREPCIVSRSLLREHQDAMDEFLHTARFGVETLYREVAGLGYVLLLTDAKGITVDFIGDPTFDNNLMRAGLYLGADWNEPNAGTCAVGTCIATGEALVVHQSDHFDATHIPLTCTAAPVYGPEGDLAAILDISALRSPEPKESQFLALQLVKSFAHKIEIANLLNRFRHDWILKLSASPEFADVDPTYVLAVDGSERILGFNNQARRLMIRELERRPASGLGRPLVGRRLSEFFEIDIDELPRFSPARPAGQRMLKLAVSGTPLFAQALPPPSRSVLAPAGAAMPDLPKPLQALHRGDAAMARVVGRAAKLVNTQMSLLICGETGTGKEHLAKAIHAASARAAKPFVAVNCAALPESLIEGELFGYEPGAFTGAAARGKKGLVLEAEGGTLFLDEIGDMPLGLQTRLLRVLAEREVTPLGRSRPVPVNIRVIAATHRDLVEAVKAGRFREDLYFRLSGAVFELPPLRERADFEWLVGRLATERARLAGRDVALSPAAVGVLGDHSWPGNIRELVNALDYACAVATDGVIRVDDLPDGILAGHRLSPRPTARAALAGAAPAPAVLPFHPSGPTDPGAAGPGAGFEQPSPRRSERWGEDLRAERAMLIQSLTARRWNVSATARDLGLDRTTVHRRMRRLGIIPRGSAGPIRQPIETPPDRMSGG